MQPVVYGLDFGTSNSSVAVLDARGATVLPVGLRGAPTVRSVLYFPENKARDLFVGERAVQEYVDRGMHGRFLQSVKTLLPDPAFEGTIITGWGMQGAADLAAHVIRHLRQRANALVGSDIRRVVLGRPVRFSQNPEHERVAAERLVTAARLAGFEEIRLQLEPIGAAYDYERTLDHDELVLIADLGGGTADFTLMRLSPSRREGGDRSGDILGNAGVYIGGDTFDSLVMRARLLKYFGEDSTYDSGAGKILPMPHHILLDLCRWQKIPFLRNPQTRAIIEYLLVYSSDRDGVRRLKSLIDDDLGFELFRAIERAKVALTDTPATRIVFDHSGIDVKEPITRDEFEVIIAAELRALDACVAGLVTESGAREADVDSVFITGGSSMVPAVRAMLGARFGAGKIRTGDTFTSVAAGLALTGLH